MKAILGLLIIFSLMTGSGAVAQGNSPATPKVLAYFKLSPGMSDIVIKMDISVYSDGNVNVDRTEYNTETHVTKKKNYLVATLGPTALAALQKSVDEIKPEFTKDENPDEPYCMDGPKFEYGAIVKGNPVILELTGDCHLVANTEGTAPLVLEVLKGFFTLVNLEISNQKMNN